MGHTRSGKRQKLTFVLESCDEPTHPLDRPSVASSLAFASVSHSSRHRSDRPLQAPSLQYQIAEASQLQQPAAGLRAASSRQPRGLSWTEQGIRIIQRPGLLLTIIPKTSSSVWSWSSSWKLLVSLDHCKSKKECQCFAYDLKPLSTCVKPS